MTFVLECLARYWRLLLNFGHERIQFLAVTKDTRIGSFRVFREFFVNLFGQAGVATNMDPAGVVEISVSQLHI